MKLYKLIRSQFTKDGVFGELFNENGKCVAVTLEHAYNPIGTEDWLPKVSAGDYICSRRMFNRGGYEVFEIENVFMNPVFLETLKLPAGYRHTDILFHVGNYNEDSDGCVLLGKTFAFTPSGKPMITESRRTFNQFMADLEGTLQFKLMVVK